MGVVVQLRPDGVCNTRPSLKSETVQTPGLDTVRLRFRDPDLDPGRYHGDGWHLHGGGVRRTAEGVTAEVRPGVAFVEGRLDALLGLQDHTLRPVAELRDAAALWAATLFTDAEPEVGRADATGELRFADGAHGRELLAALRSVDLPWIKIGTEGWKGDRVETVYGRAAAGQSVVFRVYDKGVQTETAAPGEWIRFERQARFPKRRAQTVSDFATVPLRDRFVGRELRDVSTRVESVTVCDRVGAIAELRDRVHRGELRPQPAERLAGYLALRGVGFSRATVYRRESELRRLGVAIDSSVVGRSLVPVGGYFGRVAESFDALAA